MDDNNYVFENVHELIGHIIHYLDNPTPLKLQKSLYFLWAFYSATYGDIDYNEVSEFSSAGQERYPKNLFDAHFEAWEYGPVINDIFAEYHTTNGFENLSDIDENELTSNRIEILGFIDDILHQINDVNDFGLVNRSHKDSAWSDVFHVGERHIQMSNEDIKNNYLGYVNEQSQI